MKAYLVGGAVRDQLLGYPVKERDWVVIGATPKMLLDQKYQQVGRDFPVFLHPETQEEYALARTERKSAPGYYGFSCDFNPHVTLEEDLARRDLTINAIAMDAQGQIIDPYQGQSDLRHKILRHVSPAFIEDPVRVLRVARFMARYHHLGFKVANETRALMYAMVRQGELSHLVPERVAQELFSSLQEKNPDMFIATLRSCDALRIIFPELDRLYGSPNPKTYHPEVDSGVHTMLALQEAVRLSNDTLVRFGTLVHDLGKACTPMAAWPTQRGHEELGVPVIETLCQRLRIPTNYRKFAITVSRYHLNIHRLDELRPETILRVMEQTDAFRRPELFDKLLTVCEADARGRPLETAYPQANKWRHLLAESSKISAKLLIEQGFITRQTSGDVIKSTLQQHRIACVKTILGKHET